MSTIIDRVTTALRRMPSDTAEAVATALEDPGDLGIRRSEVIAQVRAAEQAFRDVLVPLDARIEDGLAKHQKAEAAERSARETLNKAVGERESAKRTFAHQREIAIRELQELAPQTMAEAQAEGRRRVRGMQHHTLPPEFDPAEVHRANQRLHQIGAELLELPELEAAIAECLRQMPSFEGVGR